MFCFLPVSVAADRNFPLEKICQLMLYDGLKIKPYGYDRIDNVITSVEIERLQIHRLYWW